MYVTSLRQNGLKEASQYSVAIRGLSEVWLPMVLSPKSRLQLTQCLVRVAYLTFLYRLCRPLHNKQVPEETCQSSWKPLWLLLFSRRRWGTYHFRTSMPSTPCFALIHALVPRFGFSRGDRYEILPIRYTQETLVPRHRRVNAILPAARVSPLRRPCRPICFAIDAGNPELNEIV